MNIKQLLTYTNILTLICGLSQLVLITRFNLVIGIPNEIFIIFDSIIITTIAELASIPILVYCSRICPKNLEGKL